VIEYLEGLFLKDPRSQKGAEKMLDSISKAEGVITFSADFLSIKDRISKSSLVRRNFVRQLARVLGISEKEAKVRDKAEIWRKEVPKYCSGDEF
jgi:CRISPR/Cas system CMR-associated protein Cmr3 (group 5 of RAMP superfamily)